MAEGMVVGDGTLLFLRTVGGCVFSFFFTLVDDVRIERRRVVVTAAVTPTRRAAAVDGDGDDDDEQRRRDHRNADDGA